MSDQSQHWVPKFLIKNFADGDGRVFCLDIHTDRVTKPPPRQAASEKGFNDFQVEGEDISFEDRLEQIETRAAPVLKRIVSERQLTAVTPEDRRRVAEFIAAQSFRTKAFYEGLSVKLERNAFAKKFSLLLDGIEILAAEIANRHWVLMLATGNDVFYLGDNPTVLQRTDDPRDGSQLGFDVAGVEAVLPLAPHCAIYMPCRTISSPNSSRHRFAENGYAWSWSTAGLDRANQSSCRKIASTLFASASRASYGRPKAHPGPCAQRSRKAGLSRRAIGETAKRGLELVHLDTDHFKTRVFEKVRWPAGEPGSWYLPSDIEDRYCKQVVSEAKMRLASGKTRWVERSKEIHLLDLEAMQMAAAEMLNVQRISGAVRQQPAPPALEEAETGPEIAPSARPPPQQRDQDDPNAVFHSLFQEAQRPHNWVRDGGPLRPGSWLGRGR